MRGSAGQDAGERVTRPLEVFALWRFAPATQLRALVVNRSSFLCEFKL